MKGQVHYSEEVLDFNSYTPCPMCGESETPERLSRYSAAQLLTRVTQMMEEEPVGTDMMFLRVVKGWPLEDIATRHGVSRQYAHKTLRKMARGWNDMQKLLDAVSCKNMQKKEEVN